MEDECGVRFIFLDNFPDYRQDLPGALEGGRTVEPELFNSREALGSLTAHVRTDGRAPFTMQEYEDWGAFTKFPWDELDLRQKRRLRGEGPGPGVHAAGQPGPRAAQRWPPGPAGTGW